MRCAADGRHGWRLRAMIVVLWRAGLRIQEALALAEQDLDQRRGSLLVRNGKGGRRREVGMDEWGWEQLRPWLSARAGLPVGPLFCVIDGPTRGRPWSGAAVRSEFRRLAACAGVRRRFAPHQLRRAHALELAREGVALNIIQRQLGHANLGDVDLPAGDRPRGDHHGRAHTPRAGDVGQRRAAALTSLATTSGCAMALSAFPGEASARTTELTRSVLVRSGYLRSMRRDARFAWIGTARRWLRGAAQGCSCQAIARAEAMRGERGTAGQRAHALPMQGPGQERLGRADARRPLRQSRSRRGMRPLGASKRALGWPLVLLDAGRLAEDAQVAPGGAGEPVPVVVGADGEPVEAGGQTQVEREPAADRRGGGGLGRHSP
jgi:Phage integrase family